MEMDTSHQRAVSVDDVDSLIPEPGSTKASILEDISFNGEVMTRELLRAGEVLTKVELDLACSSEKLVNLSVLTMHLGTRENDFESFAAEKESLGDDSAEKAMEFDLLSAILDSEVNELENLTKYLQTEIQSARDIISPLQRLGEAFLEMEEKLHDAEKLLNQSVDQVLEMKKQSANFQRILSGLDGLGSWSGGQAAEFQRDGEFDDISAKIKMQTAEQQRNFLRMLEKSLAREMELEKKLTESRQTEEELTLRLHSSEQDVLYMEEEAEEICSRWFEAENAAEVFMGISKELLGKLRILQFNLSGSFKRENDLKSELSDSKEQLEAKESALQKLGISNARLHDFLVAQAEGLKERLKETEDKFILSNSENFTLREKISSLEEQLKEYELQTKDSGYESPGQESASGSQIRELEHVIEDLKDKLIQTEARAEVAETKCKLLGQNNVELNDELGLFRAKGLTPKKLELLEKRLRESDMQLEHAIAAVEASKEKQSMLYSTISDMENVIEDLKSKVLKAENRADSAEDKLITVSESNAELNDELGFLRGRLKEVEESLHQAEEKTMRTAKDIAVRNKIMKNLVMQLAVERERLHQQISTLSIENSVLVVTLKQSGKARYVVNDDGSRRSEKYDFSPKPGPCAESCPGETRPQETVTSATSSEDERLEGSPPETELDDTESKSDPATVSRLHVGALGLKHILTAILVLMMSGAAYYFVRQDLPF